MPWLINTPFYSFGQNSGKNYVIHQFTSENGLPQNSVKQIRFDKNGYCWLATEAGLVRFDNQHFKTFGTDDIKGLKSNRIVAMAGRSGGIVAQTLDYQDIDIGSSNSMFSQAPVLGDTDYTFVTIGYPIQNTTFDSLGLAVYRSKKVPVVKISAGLRNGDIYLFFENTDFGFFISGKNFKKIASGEIPPPSGILLLDGRRLLQVWPKNRIRLWTDGSYRYGVLEGDIAGDKAFRKGLFKTLWCEQGSFIYADGNLYSVVYSEGKVSGKLIAGNLKIDLPLCIAYSTENNTYFIGTGTQGLFTLRVSDFEYPEIPKESGPENYYTIAKTSDDKIIANNVVIPAKGKSYFVDLNNTNGRAAYVDSLDRVYYENEFKLFRYDSRTHKIDSLQQLDNRFLQIIPMPQSNDLLVCTHTSIYRLTREGKIVSRKSIPGNVKATGLTWLGDSNYLLPTNSGLKWYNMAEGRVYKSVLDSVYIRTVYVDAKSRLWIGTDGSGSFLYWGNKLYQLPLGPQKSFKSIHSFIEDKKGNFWFPTNNGLYSVGVEPLFEYVINKTNTITWLTLNKNDGLRSNEFNGGANPKFQWLKDSALLLPSLNGLVKFYPEKIASRHLAERILVDEIAVDGRTIPLDSLSHAASIGLNPEFGNVNIKVSCPYFGNRDNIHLQYRISSGSASWTEVPESGIISINTLPSGQYQLTVEKAGGANGDPNRQVSLAIVVHPFFYRTWWFILLMILLGICLAYLYLRKRVKKLKEEKQRVEKIVDVRTLELRDAVSKLELSEGELKKSNQIKEQIITTVLHDLRSPISFIKLISNSIIKNWKESNGPVLPQLIGLNRSIGELWGFTDQFFAWAVSQQHSFVIKKSYFLLHEIFAEIEALYEEGLFRNKNEFQTGTADIICFTDRQMLTLVIRNLVDNANKNTEDGIISLKGEQAVDFIKIYVSDTGKGLTEEQINKFMHAGKTTGDTGMGSIIVLEMLDKIGGKLSVNSIVGKGSEFIVELKATG